MLNREEEYLRWARFKKRLQIRDKQEGGERKTSPLEKGKKEEDETIMKRVVGNCERCGSRYGYKNELDERILCKKCIKKVWNELHALGKW